MFHSPQERVEAGAKLLDQQFPGWRTKVNTDFLNIADGDHCVLGQVIGGHFNDHAEEVGGLTLLISHGFYVPGDQHSNDVHREYNLLTAAWVEELLREPAAIAA